MRNVLLVLLLVLALIPRLLHADDTKIKNEVNAKLTQLAALMGDSYSHEYPDYRGIEILRNDKENMLVAVSIFTIEGLEGGNNYTQFMAVFSALSTAAPTHPQKMNLLDVIAVGGKGVRGIEFKNIKIRQVNADIDVTVPALEYGPSDALCCPSIKSEAHFIVRPRVGGRIKEIGNPKR